MSSAPSLTPMQMLVTAVAYVVLADKKTMPEERAELIVILGKHAHPDGGYAPDIEKLTAEAFAYVAKYDFQDFLMANEGTLTPAQVVSVMMNMYETMIVDGQVVTRERELLEDFCKFFDIDRRVLNTARELLFIKNDTSLFLRDDHPNNSSDFQCAFLDRMDLEPT